MKSLLLILALFQSAEDTYKAANVDFDAGRWTDAAAKYELVLKQDPAHVPSQFNLAVSYSKAGNASGAIAAYLKLLNQDGNLYEARTNLAIVLDQNGMPSDAAEQYEKALALRPDDPQAHFNIGMFYIRGHEIEKAYPHLTVAADKGLNSFELYAALSEAAHERKDEAKSQAYLEKASELDPANKNVRRQLGIVYREAGEFAKAIEVLRPLLPESRVELSLSYFDNKNYAEAAPLLEQVVQANPGNADYLYLLGRSYMELKLYPQVIIAMAQVVRIKPDYVEAYETVASVFFTQEDWTRAAQVLTRVVELKPTQAINHFVLATCLDKLGKVPDALLHYNKFLEYDDGSSDARSFQARQRARILEGRLKRK